MSKRKRSFVSWLRASLVVGFFMTTLLAAGCTFQRTPVERAEAIVEHMAWELNLDSTQQANAMYVADVVLQMRSALRGPDGTRHQVLFDLLTAETFDPAQAQLLYEQSVEDFGRYIPRLIHAYSVFHASLTPDQRQELGERLGWLHDNHHY